MSITQFILLITIIIILKNFLIIQKKKMNEHIQKFIKS